MKGKLLGLGAGLAVLALGMGIIWWLRGEFPIVPLLAGLAIASYWPLRYWIEAWGDDRRNNEP
jgi:hypothetical protein